MKTPSRQSFIYGLALLLVFCGFAIISAQAQNREKYIISAEAGGVNMVSGDVLVVRKGETDQEELTSTDDLRSGDRVITGQDGRVEVLLNPGSYLRVAEDSEFELADASLDRLLIRLTKGSAIVEASGGDGVELSINIKTPQTEALITRGGVYRFNVNSNHTTEIIVHKGRVQYGAGLTERLRGGRKALIGGGLAQLASTSKKDHDEFDLWSKQRAELLARANHRLQQRQRVLTAAFNTFDWNTPHTRLGVWVYSPDVRGYCYLPDGTRVWTSPYGFRYGTGTGYYNSCYSCPGTRPGGGGNNYPTTNTTTAGGGGGGGNSGGGNGGNNGGGNTTPTYVPPPSPPATPVYTPPPSPPPPAPVDGGRSTPSRTEQSPN